MQFRAADKSRLASGFTLVELSIVLVIIGLIIGGVLVGRDLIDAAAIRAQISQIEKYNTAVNTFRGKYGYLPGDIPNPTATQYGFVTRGTSPGEGDGDGLLQGNYPLATSQTLGLVQGSGENAMFWVDLSAAFLVDGGFNTANPISAPASISGAAINQYLPQAKIGQGNFLYTYSGDYWNGSANINTGINYFGLSANPTIGSATDCGPCLTSTPGLSTAQAYAIDKKIDDGYPQSGRVMAWYLMNGGQVWTDGTNATYIAGEPKPNTAATSPSPATCYDNQGLGGNQQYSMGQNNGAGLNCALSFQFQ